ncbi:hypothetical protein D9M72_498260 [compost metagenome]
MRVVMDEQATVDHGPDSCPTIRIREGFRQAGDDVMYGRAATEVVKGLQYQFVAGFIVKVACAENFPCAVNARFRNVVFRQQLDEMGAVLEPMVTDVFKLKLEVAAH